MECAPDVEKRVIQNQELGAPRVTTESPDEMEVSFQSIGAMSAPVERRG